MRSLCLRILALILLSSAACTVVAAVKPNIVFILTDDQGYGDLSCHGNPILQTPNMDRLYEEGGEIHRFPCQSHLCTDTSGSHDGTT